jgi:putative aminopeptidase FrvX
LRSLLAIPSPTGYTDNVVRACSAELDRLGLKFELTRRGAIRAIYPGGKGGRLAPSSPISTRSARR